jgi:hypothetical protein
MAIVGTGPCALCYSQIASCHLGRFVIRLAGSSGVVMQCNAAGCSGSLNDGVRLDGRGGNVTSIIE